MQPIGWLLLTHLLPIGWLLLDHLLLLEHLLPHGWLLKLVSLKPWCMLLYLLPKGWMVNHLLVNLLLRAWLVDTNVTASWMASKLLLLY